MFKKDLSEMLAPIRREAEEKSISEKDVEIEIAARRARKSPCMIK